LLPLKKKAKTEMKNSKIYINYFLLENKLLLVLINYYVVKINYE